MIDTCNFIRSHYITHPFKGNSVYVTLLNCGFIEVLQSNNDDEQFKIIERAAIGCVWKDVPSHCKLLIYQAM
jgi:hypothetical protein